MTKSGTEDSYLHLFASRMGSGSASQPDSLRQEDFQSEARLGYRKFLSQKKTAETGFWVWGPGRGSPASWEELLGASDLRRKSSTTVRPSCSQTIGSTGIEAMLDCGHDGGYPSVHTQCLV